MARFRKDEEEEPLELSYLQPEILPVEIMLELLREKGAIGPTCMNDRAKVVELFRLHVTPKPQRPFINNRRGIVLSKLRRRREGNKVEEGLNLNVIDSKRSMPGKRSSSSVSSGVINDASSSAADRLKPPPSCINHERKKIKLGGGTKTGNPVDIQMVRKEQPIIQVKNGTSKRPCELLQDDWSSLHLAHYPGSEAMEQDTTLPH
ncbi:uncharacterized protein LOC143028561 isoform X2 [Oratosquilla oratoria]|uniref:uncharacterized protein LOC143028561 isoform X2 n=1 Tax=Oratosquilla oratoria TaxID=337810 RepID=UPI003F76F0EB